MNQFVLKKKVILYLFLKISISYIYIRIRVVLLEKRYIGEPNSQIFPTNVNVN